MKLSFGSELAPQRSSFDTRRLTKLLACVPPDLVESVVVARLGPKVRASSRAKLLEVVEARFPGLVREAHSPTET